MMNCNFRSKLTACAISFAMILCMSPAAVFADSLDEEVSSQEAEGQAVLVEDEGIEKTITAEKKKKAVKLGSGYSEDEITALANCSESITFGETKIINLPDGGYIALKFVPQKTATYVFKAKSKNRTIGAIYNSSLESIACDEYTTGPDSVIVKELKQGQTYYIVYRQYKINLEGDWQDCSEPYTINISEPQEGWSPLSPYTKGEFNQLLKSAKTITKECTFTINIPNPGDAQMIAFNPEEWKDGQYVLKFNGVPDDIWIYQYDANKQFKFSTGRFVVPMAGEYAHDGLEDMSGKQYIIAKNVGKEKIGSASIRVVSMDMEYIRNMKERFSTAGKLKVGESKNFRLVDTEDKLLKFVAPDNGTYQILSKGKGELVWALLIDSDTNLLSELTNDIEAKLKKGKTYYLLFQTNARTKKTFSVIVKEKPKFVAAKAATFKAAGHRAYYKYNGKIYKDKACTKETTIAKRKIPAIKSVKLSDTKMVYDGKANKPSVIAKDKKDKTIASSNYTVTYPKDSKNIGPHKATVKFKKLYSGSKSLSYVVNPRKTNVKTCKGIRKGFTVSWNKKGEAAATGYEIRYSTSSEMSNPKKVKVKKNSTSSKSVKKLKAKEMYYIQIRTYKTVDGKTYYSSWSEKTSVTTK